MKRAALACSLIVVATAAFAQDGPRLSSERIALQTTLGTLVVALYPGVAPQHAEQILRLTRLGAYDTVPIYRVHAGFVIQVADVAHRRAPLTADQSQALRKLPLEIGPLRHRRGRLSMARWPNDPSSAESSFSILLAEAPHLDGEYTIFGEVVAGQELLDAFTRVPVDGEYRPRRSLEIVRATVLAEGEQPPAAPIRDAPPGWWPVWGPMLLIATGLGTFGLSRLAPPPMVGSFGLLTVLIGFFAWLVVMPPSLRSHPAFATGQFLGLLGVFRLMALFESGRAR